MSEGRNGAGAQTEALTRAFYEWEAWGRGWLQAPEPVALEPPLTFPLWHRPVAHPQDDTRRAHWLRRLFQSQPAPQPTPYEIACREPSVTLRPVRAVPEQVEVALLPERGSRFAPALALSWLSTLSALSSPLAFEVLRERGRSAIRLAYEPREHALVASSLLSVAPRVHLEPAPPMAERWRGAEGAYTLGFEFALASEFVAPLGFPTHDALSGVLAALAQLGAQEAALWQVLLVPVAYDWPSVIEAAVVSPTGHPFFADAPDLTSGVGEKLASPLFAVAARGLVSSSDPDRPFEVASALHGALGLLRGRNALVPLSDVDAEALEGDLLGRVSRRLGMVLSARELAGLVSLPQEATGTLGLTLYSERQAPPRRSTGIVLGESEGEGLDEGEVVRLDTQDRLRHAHVVGASGSGKSNLLLSMITQDLEAGAGLALLDPHGDLADAVLARVPEARLADVVVLDPAEPERVVGWNVLAAETEAERELLASDLVGVFRRLSTSWGDQMTTVLANAVLSSLASTERPTLLELRRFLVDDAFRARFLRTVSDPYLRAFWTEEWPLLVGRRPQAPILTRLDGLLRNRLVRDVLTLREGALDFRALLDDSRVLVARLSQGQIGRDNAALLGALLVSRLHQAGLSRADTGVSARAPFFVYLDEFHEVATPSMATLFSGIRKFGLGLTVAHQDLYQLGGADRELKRAVLTNAHVRLCFRVDEEDARRLERGFAHFTAEDLASLPVGSAVARIGGAGSDFRLRTPLVPELDGGVAEHRRAEVLERSRVRYGVPRPPVPNRGGEQTPVEQQEPEARATQPPPQKPPEPASAPEPPAPESVAISEAEEPVGGLTAPPAAEEAEQEGGEGRGGPEHRYLQSLIRSWAQERGYRADLEAELESGGRVDLVITLPAQGEEAPKRVAVEISVTTGVEHETENARKCLRAGFESVVVVSRQQAFRRQLQRALTEVLSSEEAQRVQVLAPDDFLAQLSALPAATEAVAGYTVRLSTADPQAASERRTRLNEIIARSVRKR